MGANEWAGLGKLAADLIRRELGEPEPLDAEARTNAALDALYAELPALTCQRKCRECCGPVVQTASMSRAEYLRLADVPRRPFDRRDFMACSLLTREGKCSAYALRPLVCRLWGIVETMRCPYGCVPERWLTKEEGFAFLRRAEQIGGPPPGMAS